MASLEPERDTLAQSQRSCFSDQVSTGNTELRGAANVK